MAASTEPESEIELLRRENCRLEALVPAPARAVSSKDVPDPHVAQVGIPKEGALTIVVLGATGDLFAKKTGQALWSLRCADLLPERAIIVGYARSQWTNEKFRDFLKSKIKPHTPELDSFLQKCHYVGGQYDSKADIAKLNTELEALEEKNGGSPANRIFYFAIPPFAFSGACAAIAHSGMSRTGWSRMVLEKPFGSDSASYNELAMTLRNLFCEEQMYRIDHYLGKEMVQNLMALRFANAVFEPLWNNTCISSVQIVFKEEFGTEGRGGYFDKYGILRDVMQNHLLQILALVGMEAPVSADAADVRDEKVKVLKCVDPISLKDVVLGQYTKSADGSKPGYLDDEGVPKDSNTATFATVVMHINNRRWSGVPFIMKCGKALNERKAEIRIQFKPTPGRLYTGAAQNELVLRVGPDEAVYMKITTKVPGLSNDTQQTELDLTYNSRYKETRLPDAYERLILDVIRGDHSLFVRHDELAVAWGLFTPLLEAIDKIKPLPYEYGSRGPAKADEMISQYYARSEGYSWKTPESRL